MVYIELTNFEIMLGEFHLEDKSPRLLLVMCFTSTKPHILPGPLPPGAKVYITYCLSGTDSMLYYTVFAVSYTPTIDQSNDIAQPAEI